MYFYALIGLLGAISTLFSIGIPLSGNAIEQVKTLSYTTFCPLAPLSSWCQKKTIDGPRVLQHPPRFGVTHYFAPPSIDNAFSSASVENILVLIDNTSSSYVAPDASYFCVGNEASPHFYQSRPRQLKVPSLCDAAKDRTPQAATTKELSIVSSAGFAEDQRWYTCLSAYVQSFANSYGKNVALLILVVHIACSSPYLQKPSTLMHHPQETQDKLSSKSFRARLMLKDAASSLILSIVRKNHLKELERVHTELHQAQDELEQAKHTAKQTQSKLQQAEIDLEQSQNDLNQAQGKLVQAQSDTKEAQNKLDQEQNAHFATVSNLKKEHEQAVEEQVDSRNQDLRRKVNSLEKEHKSVLQELIESHKKELKCKEDEYKSTISSRVSSIKSANKKIQQDFESEIRELKKKHQVALQDVKESCKHDIQSIEDDYKSAIATCEQRCQSQISDMESTYEKQNQNLNWEFGKATKELAALKQAEKSRKQEADRDLTLAKLKKEQAVAEAAKLRSEKAKLEDEHAANKVNLEEAHNRISELQNELVDKEQKAAESAAVLETSQVVKVDVSSQTDQAVLHDEEPSNENDSTADQATAADQAKVIEPSTSTATNDSSTEIDASPSTSSASDQPPEKKEGVPANQVGEEAHEQDNRDDQDTVQSPQTQDQPLSNGKDLMSLILASNIGLEDSRWAKASPSTSTKSTRQPNRHQNESMKPKPTGTHSSLPKSQEPPQTRATSKVNGATASQQSQSQSHSGKNALLSSKWATDNDEATSPKSSPVLQNKATVVSTAMHTQPVNEPPSSESRLAHCTEPVNATTTSSNTSNPTSSKPPISRSLGASRWAAGPPNPGANNRPKSFRGEASEFKPSLATQQSRMPGNQHQQAPPLPPQVTQQATLLTSPQTQPYSAPANAPHAPRAMYQQLQQQQYLHHQQLQSQQQQRLQHQSQPQQQPLTHPSLPTTQLPPKPAASKPKFNPRHADGWTGGAGPHAHESPLGEERRNPNTKLKNALKRAGPDKEKRREAIREWEERTGKEYAREKAEGRVW